MNRRTELLAYMGTTIVTIVGLFTLQAWYATYIDVSVVHGDKSEVALDSKVSEARQAEHTKLGAGRMPIEAAKKAIAVRGRIASDRIAPKASEDLSAMSGWAFRPGFKPYEPRATRAAAEPVAQPAAVKEQAP